MRDTTWPESPELRALRNEIAARYTYAREDDWGGLYVVRRAGVKVGTTQSEQGVRMLRGNLIARELNDRR